MKSFIFRMMLIVVVLFGCAKDEGPGSGADATLTAPETRDSASAGQAQTGVAGTPGDAAVAAPEENPSAALLPGMEEQTDQSSPNATLVSFLTELNIILDPHYAMDSGNAEKVARGLQAHRRLRRLFVSQETATEVCGYLGLIQVAGVKMTSEATIEGERATIAVMITKGEGLELDPKRFGEKSDKEAETKVEFVQRAGRWMISDFGGLAVFADKNI